jgi:DNA-binding NtrC family response regulator
VTLFRSGNKAVEAARQGRFDLAVVDLNMPAPDGWAVLAGLHEHDPGLPVVIATGYGDAAEVSRRGGAALLQKPYEQGALIRLAAHLVPAQGSSAAGG